MFLLSCTILIFLLFTVACRQNNSLQLKKILRQLYGIALLLQNKEVPINAKDVADQKIPYVAELPLQSLQQFTEFDKKLKEDAQLRHDFVSKTLFCTFVIFLEKFLVLEINACNLP